MIPTVYSLQKVNTTETNKLRLINQVKRSDKTSSNDIRLQCDRPKLQEHEEIISIEWRLVKIAKEEIPTRDLLAVTCQGAGKRLEHRNHKAASMKKQYMVLKVEEDERVEEKENDNVELKTRWILEERIGY